MWFRKSWVRAPSSTRKGLLRKAFFYNTQITTHLSKYVRIFFLVHRGKNNEKRPRTTLSVTFGTRPGESHVRRTFHGTSTSCTFTANAFKNSCETRKSREYNAAEQTERPRKQTRLRKSSKFRLPRFAQQNPRISRIFL